TWLQHHGVVIALAGTTNGALRDELLEATTSGRLRAGVAYAGVVPTPPRMRATRVDGGWRFDGYAQFVSGW
ncbi:acyl-CoA dehydrogenase, partial [Streptomyces sp. SID10244]|nr:acyl-CoA dehydrogenase [Streptomyces sp. SID10244]